MPGGTPVGEAFVTVRPDTRGFAGEAESGIGAPMKRLVGAIAALFVASRVKEWISGWVAEAQEAVKVEAQTGAVIKSTGGAARVSADHVGAYAEKLAALTGIDDEVIQKGQNMLLTFTNVQNKVGEGNNIFDQATQTMLDMSTALGQDTAASAMQLGKALNDPINGVTALRRVGVQLTDAQEQQIKAFVEAGDVMSAQKIILGELNKEFGGSAAAQATAADRMKVIWGNLKEDLGKAILPALDQIFPALQGLIEDLAPAIKPLASMLGQGLAGAFKLIGPIVQALLPVLQSLFPVVMDIAKAFAPLIPAVAQLAAAVASALVPVLAALVPMLEPLIAALAQVFVEVAKSGALEELGLAFVAVLQAVMPLIPVIVQLILALTPIIVLATQIAAVLINVLAAAVGWLVQAFVNAGTWIVGAWNTLYGGLRAAWGFIKGNVLDPMWNAVLWVQGVAVGAWSAIVAGFNAMKSALKATWDWIKHNVVDPMVSAFNVVKDIVSFIVGGGASSAQSTLERYSGVQIGQNAMGTGSWKGGLTWVGERGAELLDLPGGTRIYSHEQSMGMAGTNVTIDDAGLGSAAKALIAAASLLASGRAASAREIATAARLG